MPRKPAPLLKVTLNQENSQVVRDYATKTDSTPPKVLNRIAQNWAVSVGALRGARKGKA